MGYILSLVALAWRCFVRVFEFACVAVCLGVLILDVALGFLYMLDRFCVGPPRPAAQVAPCRCSCRSLSCKCKLYPPCDCGDGERCECVELNRRP